MWTSAAAFGPEAQADRVAAVVLDRLRLADRPRSRISDRLDARRRSAAPASASRGARSWPVVEAGAGAPPAARATSRSTSAGVAVVVVGALREDEAADEDDDGHDQDHDALGRAHGRAE